MASGVDLGARRASIMSISWGGLWAIGGSVVGSLQGCCTALKTAHHKPPNGPQTPPVDAHDARQPGPQVHMPLK